MGQTGIEKVLNVWAGFVHLYLLLLKKGAKTRTCWAEAQGKGAVLQVFFSSRHFVNSFISCSYKNLQKLCLAFKEAFGSMSKFQTKKENLDLRSRIPENKQVTSRLDRWTEPQKPICAPAGLLLNLDSYKGATKEWIWFFQQERLQSIGRSKQFPRIGPAFWYSCVSFLFWEL